METCYTLFDQTLIVKRHIIRAFAFHMFSLVKNFYSWVKGKKHHSQLSETEEDIRIRSREKNLESRGFISEPVETDALSTRLKPPSGLDPAAVDEPSGQVQTEKLARAFLFDGRHQPWRILIKAPEEVNPIPSMIIPDEAKFLHYLAREQYKGEGAIVEFGPLAGGSTHALALGASENVRINAQEARIVSYDLWRFCDDWSYLFPGHRLRPGDDLTEIFLENLKCFRSQIKPYKGDLAAQHWSGGPIEIMFIDAAKSPTLMTHIVNEFFPYLIPNRSFVIHQDYISAECPWIHVIAQYLHEYFEYMDSPAGGTVCARLKKPIPSGLLPVDFFDKLSTNEARHLLFEAREIIVGWYKLCVWLAEANYLCRKGLVADALHIIEEVQLHPQFHPRVQFDIDLVTTILRSNTFK